MHGSVLYHKAKVYMHQIPQKCCEGGGEQMQPSVCLASTCRARASLAIGALTRAQQGRVKSTIRIYIKWWDTHREPRRLGPFWDARASALAERASALTALAARPTAAMASVILAARFIVSAHLGAVWWCLRLVWGSSLTTVDRRVFVSFVAYMYV